MWILRYFQWGHFQLQDSSGVSDFSTGVKKWSFFGNIFHWGDEWGGSQRVTEAGVFYWTQRHQNRQKAKFSQK